MKLKMSLFTVGGNIWATATPWTYALIFRERISIATVAIELKVNSSTMNKLKLFIKWMSTRMKDIKFELSPEYLLTLTYEEFNVFRQVDMPSMCSKPTSPPLSSTLQEVRQAKLSYANLIICLKNLFLTLLKPYLIKKWLILPPLHFFNLLPTLLEASKDKPEFTLTFMTCALHLITHLKM